MLYQIRSTAGLLLSSFFLLIGSGLTGILLPLRAGLEGWSSLTIGLMGSFYAACFLAGCILIPHMVRRIGHIRVFAAVATLLSISLMGHSILVNLPAWFLFRGIAGFALAGSYMVVESWLNEQATNESRGLLFSAYMVINASGLIIGQALLVIADPALTTLFIVAAIFYAAAVIPTAISNAVSPQPPNHVSFNLKKLYQTSPVAVIGALVSGITFGAWNFQAPVYGALAGLSDGQIATMLIVAMIGGIVMQFPLGRASDKVDRRIIMLFAVAIGLIASLIFVFFEPTSLLILLTLMFFFGGVLMPLYSLIVAHANDRADPGAFVETSSTLLVVYGIGSMVGPTLAGYMIETFGRGGFFITIIISFTVFAIFTILRISQAQAQPDDDDRVDFSYGPVGRAQTPEVFQLDPRSEEEGQN